MNTFYKTALATGISLATLFLTASTAYADGVATPTPTRTATPTPTSTPTPETRVEYTTGAYGQQTCKTVVIQRTATPVKHEVVNSGLSENISIAILAIFALSSIGYTYSKVSR